jgi:hypothetical protein
MLPRISACRNNAIIFHCQCATYFFVLPYTWNIFVSDLKELAGAQNSAKRSQPLAAHLSVPEKMEAPAMLCRVLTELYKWRRIHEL